MEPERDPFDVLGIAPDSGPDAIEFAYRAKARMYHPDVAGPAGADEMKAINWARDELRRDPDEWRRLAAVRRNRAIIVSPRKQRTGGSSARHATSAVESTTVRRFDWLEVSPQVLFFAGIAGVSGDFSVWPHEATSRVKIKARIRSEYPVEVQRMHSTGQRSTFRATFTTNLEKGHDASVFEIELTADGVVSNRVFIVATPISVADQVPHQGRIAPARIVDTTQRISFGKHKGRMFSQVAIEEPSYLRWMLREGAGSVIERQCAATALGIDWEPKPFEVRREELTTRSHSRPPAIEQPTGPSWANPPLQVPRARQVQDDAPRLPERTEPTRGLIARAKRLLLGGPK